MSEEKKVSAESQVSRRSVMNNPDNLKRLDKLTKAAETIDREEKAALTIDFDQALREHEKGSAPLFVKLRGKTFKLPGNVPFGYMIWYFTNVKENGGKLKIDPVDTPAYLLKIFGGDFLSFVQRQNVSFDFVVNTMVPKIMDKWNPENVAEVDEKNEQTPGSSSGDGPTSKQTSSGSTK